MRNLTEKCRSAAAAAIEANDALLAFAAEAQAVTMNLEGPMDAHTEALARARMDRAIDAFDRELARTRTALIEARNNSLEAADR